MPVETVTDINSFIHCAARFGRSVRAGPRGIAQGPLYQVKNGENAHKEGCRRNYEWGNHDKPYENL